MAARKRKPSKTSGKALPVPVHSRVAPQVEGAEFTEIKSTIEGRNIDEALKAFGLTPKNSEQRFIYFFDTPDQKLFKAHVVVRARRVPGKRHDSTIKIRPVEPVGVAAEWKKLNGFKIEADAGASGIVLSASLTRPVEKGRIKKLEAGDADLASIFDQDQKQFLTRMCGISANLDALVPFGPVDVSWWKTSYTGLPVPMTAELWRRSDGATLLELSIRIDSRQAAFASGGFLAFLADLGAKPDNASQAKTRWAMEVRGPAAKTRKAESPKTKRSAEKKSLPSEAREAASASRKHKPAASPAKRTTMSRPQRPDDAQAAKPMPGSASPKPRPPRQRRAAPARSAAVALPAGQPDTAHREPSPKTA